MTEAIQTLYHGGYLLTDRANRVPDGFHTVQLPSGAYFHHAPNLSVTVERDGINWLLFAGFGIDTVSCQVGNLGRPLFDALVSSEERMFDVLDHISGRFVAVYRCGNRMAILNDACGLKTIFYSGSRVSSHVHLLARHVQAPASKIETARIAADVKFRRGYPGASTPYHEVWALTPNTALNLNTGRPFRYFPRKPLGDTLSYQEAAEIIIPPMKRQVEALLGAGIKPIVSLTAGLDSRVTAAVVRSVTNGAKYFTYMHPGIESHENDVRVAQAIAARFGFDHDALILKREALPPEVAAAMRESLYPHSNTVAHECWRRYRGGGLHLRSNLGEIGRAFYFTNGKTLPPFGRSSDLKNLTRIRGIPAAAGLFDDFLKRADYAGIFDYPPYDMFYWEHRMGTWHSGVVMSFDAAFDTHILFNFRKMLVNMLRVPFEERKAGLVMHYIVSKLWPEVEEVLRRSDVPCEGKADFGK